MKVLIVHESKLIRDKLVELLLENEQINTILQSDTPSETRKFLLKFSPELVILDIDFSDGIGIEILSFIKKVKPKTKIIIHYAYIDAQYHMKFNELGADYIMQNSSELELLNEIVKDFNII